MDFELNEEQRMFQKMCRDFAQKEIEPLAAELDEEEKPYPRELVRKAGELGIIGVAMPEEYGGGGSDSVTFSIGGEEICSVSAGFGTMVLASISLAGYPIYAQGTDEQKKKYLAPIISGDKMAAFALTESGAGSDPAALVTSAKRDGDDYIINGTKTFITNGGEAEIIVTFGTVDKSLKHRGIMAFIMDRDTPGFSVGKLEKKLGIRSSTTAELVFDNCRVPAENCIGGEGKGFRISLEAIDSSRTAVAAQAVGIARAAFDAALTYAKDRQQFGQPIATFQAIQWMLADMATYVDAARLLTHRACWLKDHGLPFVKEAAMAKVFAAEAAMSITTKAIQIHGGYGYVKDYPVERYFRDAKITEIYEGTSEIQRLTIIRSLLAEG